MRGEDRERRGAQLPVFFFLCTGLHFAVGRPAFGAESNALVTALGARAITVR
jgi:hypothetical protein